MSLKHKNPPGVITPKKGTLGKWWWTASVNGKTRFTMVPPGKDSLEEAVEDARDCLRNYKIGKPEYASQEGP